MTLPTSRELREMLDEADPGPWELEQLNVQWVGSPKVTKFRVTSEDDRDIATVEVLSDCYDQTGRNFTLISLAPQLAEEVIRLREEVNRIKQYCLDGVPRRSPKYHP